MAGKRDMAAMTTSAAPAAARGFVTSSPAPPPPGSWKKDVDEAALSPDEREKITHFLTETGTEDRFEVKRARTRTYDNTTRA